MDLCSGDNAFLLPLFFAVPRTRNGSKVGGNSHLFPFFFFVARSFSFHTGTGRQGKRAKWFILEESFVSQFDYFAAIVITKLLLNIFEHPFFDNACQLYHFFAFKFDSSWLFQSTEFPSILTKLKSAYLWLTNWACSESNRVLKFRHNVCLGHKNNWLKGNLRHLATSLPFGPFTVKNVEIWALTEPSCS